MLTGVEDAPSSARAAASGAAVALIGLLLLFHFGYSIAAGLAPARQNLIFLTGSVILAALLALIVARWRSLFAADRDIAPVRSASAISAAFASLMVGSAGYFSLPNRIAIPAGAVFVALQVALVAYRKFRSSLLLSCSVLLLGLVLAVAYTSIQASQADMLPVTIWADRVFLDGLNPYFEDHCSVTPWPFFYLPVQWLIYLPFVAARVDPRLLNLAMALGTLGLYFLVWRDVTLRWAGFAVLLAFIASRLSTEMVYQGEAWPIWFLLSAFIVAYSQYRLRLSAVIVGLLLACSQTAIVLAALLPIYHLRSGESWRKLFTPIGIAIAVYAAIVLPFAHKPFDFMVKNYVTLPHLAAIMNERSYQNSLTQISLVNLLTRLGLGEFRAFLQVAAGLTAMVVLATRRQTSQKEFFAICGMTYFVTLALNVQVWKYYYGQGLIFLFWSSFGPVRRPLSPLTTSMHHVLALSKRDVQPAEGEP